ncbi:hypothetical protein NDN08_006188 [Rhodosorus marinus]|uniref:RING-CH-type domain-containing protein n=1 Tax=Rhodosorus marinus TaxID=101924 RepID=A0AAV8UJZ6_9RHOD|nr:hypothetical protein NDN08_006188 [Rhodosorus marinus]
MGLLPRDEEAGNLEPFCRICLGGDDEDDCGHLMTPCNCTGSLRHVHKKCFETWTKNCPPLPESGTLVGAILGLLAHAGYYWLCTRIRCELCGASKPSERCGKAVPPLYRPCPPYKVYLRYLSYQQGRCIV